MRKLSTGLLVGVIAIAPFIAVLLLLHEIIGHAHLPIELLHSTFGVVVMDAVLFAEYAVVMIPYFLWGMVVCITAYFVLYRKSQSVCL